MIVAFIDVHKSEFGVEPICRDLQVGSSSYYAHLARPPSPRSVTDAATTAVIRDVHAANYGVYGVRKVHAELNPTGSPGRALHGPPPHADSRPAGDLLSQGPAHHDAGDRAGHAP